MNYPTFMERIETVKENIQHSKNPLRIANVLRQGFVNDVMMSYQSGGLSEKESIDLTVLFDDMIFTIINADDEPVSNDDERNITE